MSMYFAFDFLFSTTGAPVRKPSKHQSISIRLPHPLDQLIARHANPAAAGCCRQHIVHTFCRQKRSAETFPKRIARARPPLTTPQTIVIAPLASGANLHSENFASRFASITCVQIAIAVTNGASFYVSTMGSVLKRNRGVWPFVWLRIFSCATIPLSYSCGEYRYSRQTKALRGISLVMNVVGACPHFSGHAGTKEMYVFQLMTEE